jgi:heme A synthase
MTSSALLVTFTVGTAVLALWSYLRWPGAAPATMKGAVVRVAIALVLLQVGAGALDVGLAVAPSLALLVVAGAVVPVLTYAFLASIWFLKVCADQIRGAA